MHCIERVRLTKELIRIELVDNGYIIEWNGIRYGKWVCQTAHEVLEKIDRLLAEDMERQQKLLLKNAQGKEVEVG